MKKVFEPFFSTKPHGKGTGLGLAMVYQMLKTHNAYIDIKSRPGKGTNVIIYFPACSALPEKQTGGVQAVFEKGSGEKILLVDDDEMVLDVCEQTLESLGYNVAAYNNPSTALKAFTANPADFNLVFSDLTMPDMDGVELVRAIRKVRNAFPAIICTGNAESMGTDAQNEFTVLSKPSSRTEIASTVSALLDRKDN